MFPKHISAYTLIISLIIVIRCDQPPLPALPLPQPVQIHGIIRHQVPLIGQQLPSHYALRYPPSPLMPLPHPPDYEDSEPAYGHTSGESEHGAGQKGENEQIHHTGKKYTVTHTKHTAYKSGGHNGYGQYGEGPAPYEGSSPEQEHGYGEKGTGYGNDHNHNHLGSPPNTYEKGHDTKAADPGTIKYASPGYDNKGHEKYDAHHGYDNKGHEKYDAHHGHDKHSHGNGYGDVTQYKGHHKKYEKYEVSHGYDSGYGHEEHGGHHHGGDHGGGHHGGGWGGPHGGGGKKQILHSDKRKRGGWHKLDFI